MFISKRVCVAGGGSLSSVLLGPSQIYLGFMFVRDDPVTWSPNVRLQLIEEFPTTPYDSLKAGKGFTAVSNGSFQSSAFLILDKILFFQ